MPALKRKYSKVQPPFFYCIAQRQLLEQPHVYKRTKLLNEQRVTLHVHAHGIVHVHLCMQREYCELSSGEFTGGGAPLSGAAGRKPCVQPPPPLTRQCAKFSSSSLCLVSMTAIAQRCLYMHVHIGGGLCQLFESQRAPHRGRWPLVSSLQQLHGQQTC